MNVSGKRTQVEYTKAIDSPSFWSCLSAFLKFACTKGNRVKERKQRIREGVTIKQTRGTQKSNVRKAWYWNCSELALQFLAGLQDSYSLPYLYTNPDPELQKATWSKNKFISFLVLYQCSGYGCLWASGSGSFYQQANKLRKTLTFDILKTLYLWRMI
jgi:hypothetical protein